MFAFTTIGFLITFTCCLGRSFPSTHGTGLAINVGTVTVSANKHLGLTEGTLKEADTSFHRLLADRTRPGTKKLRESFWVRHEAGVCLQVRYPNGYLVLPR